MSLTVPTGEVEVEFGRRPNRTDYMSIFVRFLVAGASRRELRAASVVARPPLPSNHICSEAD